MTVPQDRPAPTSPPRSIVVIPAYNEEAALAEVLAQLAEHLPAIDVVVIDDGSDDATGAVARAAGVTCIRLPFNMGIGGALRTGFRYAHEQGYDRAVQFDADGQHRADQIGVLLDELDRGAHLVIGNRFAGSRYRVGPARRAAMTLLRCGVRVLCRRRFSDTSSGFRAVSQPLLGAFAVQYPVEYMDSVETLVSTCRAGYTVSEVPVMMGPRTGGVPSTRAVRLVYHYARLVVALLMQSRRSLPPAPGTST